MFERDGLDVSIEAIARAAQLGIGTVYRHFPTKQALVAAIARTYFEEFVRRAAELHDAPHAAEALVTLVTMMAEGAAKRDLIDALGGSKWVDSDEIRPMRAALFETIAALLARAQAAGELRDDVSAAELVAIMRGLFQPAVEPAARPRLVRIIFEGLYPR